MCFYVTVKKTGQLQWLSCGEVIVHCLGYCVINWPFYLLLLQDMTAYNGYAWFLPAWFTHEWWLIDGNKRQFYGETIPCTSAEMERAVAGHFFFNTAFLGPEESVIVGNLTVKDWAGMYLSRLDALVSILIRSIIQTLE